MTRVMCNPWKRIFNLAPMAFFYCVFTHHNMDEHKTIHNNGFHIMDKMAISFTMLWPSVGPIDVI
jgi:hypothetical protein